MPSASFTASTVVRTVALAALAACTFPASAAFTLYTDEASFMAAIGGARTDGFDDLPWNETFGGADDFDRIDRAIGDFAYSVTVAGGFYAAGTAADPSLSSADQATIGFDRFSSGVQAFGGYFRASDYDGSFLSGEWLSVTATDRYGSFTQSLVDTSSTAFLGFLSTVDMLSFSVAVVDRGSNNAFAAVDNLTFGQVSAVPEPSTYALMLAGLGVVATVARRRRRG